MFNFFTILHFINKRLYYNLILKKNYIIHILNYFEISTDYLPLIVDNKFILLSIKILLNNIFYLFIGLLIFNDYSYFDKKKMYVHFFSASRLHAYMNIIIYSPERGTNLQPQRYSLTVSGFDEKDFFNKFYKEFNFTFISIISIKAYIK